MENFEQIWAQARQSIKAHEGFRDTQYRDTQNKRTIGYGTLLQGNGLSINEMKAIGVLEPKPNQITRGQAEVLLDMRMQQNWAEVVKSRPSVEKMPPHVQVALIDMSYNLGPTGLLGFNKMLNALEAGDYDTAALQALDSKWATQVGERATHTSEMIRGNVPVGQGIQAPGAGPMPPPQPSAPPAPPPMDTQSPPPSGSGQPDFPSSFHRRGAFYRRGAPMIQNRDAGRVQNQGGTQLHRANPDNIPAPGSMPKGM